MTRLKTEDIAFIPSGLDNYDRQLFSSTGYTLRQIACFAAHIEEDYILDYLVSTDIAVIPVTTGEGIINGFTESVSKIVSHIGFNSFVTVNIDVAGLAEAVRKKADILMIADDNSFIALNSKSQKVAENFISTGRGFASGLELMTGGLTGRKVLVIGCGPVGCSAVEFLCKTGAELSVYDIHKNLCIDISTAMKDNYNSDIKIEDSLESALTENSYIIDATPAANIIDENAITSETFVSAPGVPHGLSPGALEKISGRFLHDPLQIGVATMAIEALTHISHEEFI